jgi:protein tyrosine phosphatase
VSLLYISTQAPIPNTIGDFWRMVHLKRSNIILMLTKLVEQDKIKADEYWPTDLNESIEFFPMKVTLTAVSSFQDLIIRKIKVERTGDDNPVETFHIHYTGWPDFGVPKDMELYAEFFKKYREIRSHASGPVVAHCSAGIGRSGTFIAVDMLLDNIADKLSKNALPIINIPRLIHELRLQRPGIVQTKQQFTFIYEFLDYCIENNLFGISKSNILDQ